MKNTSNWSVCARESESANDACGLFVLFIDVLSVMHARLKMRTHGFLMANVFHLSLSFLILNHIGVSCLSPCLIERNDP